MSDYTAFLRQKIKLAQFKGFEVDPAELNPKLKPHTADIVRWALLGGQRAIFASFGLHKTVTALEIMRLIGKRRAGVRAIVCPLGVRREFIDQAAQHFTGEFALDVRFVNRDSQIDDDRTIYLTNYEAVREGNVNPSRWLASNLDEASVLRSYGSKTYQEFLPAFQPVEFKFVATATPSPNRFKELIHYAGYLGVMDTGQALTRFFQRDSEKAGNLTLYPHKEQEFWLWVASWAVFIQRPSDLGHSDDGYVLPELDVRYHEVPSDYSKAGEERDGQALMFTDPALGLSAAAAEKRDSMPARVAKVAEILAADPADHFVVWHDLEAERHALQAAIPEAVSVWGNQDLTEREDRIADFGDGKFRVLSTKPVIAGSGCNFQRHCHREVFAGIGFKFNDFIQSVHRVQRFGQAHPVRIDIVHTEAEREVLRELLAKWAQHDETQTTMTEIIRKFGLSQLAMQETLARSLGVERVVVSGDRFTVANNDCVEEAKAQPDNSVDLIVTSIPFANHYEYSPSYNDFGHTEDNAQFWAQMDFLTPELLRILKPGRIAAIHVKDRIDFGNVTGKGLPTVSPFHAETLAHYAGIRSMGLPGHGFDYLGMITVVTDVVRENNQTYRLGYTEMRKDGSKMGCGSPEYILLFHKPQTDRSKGYADSRISKRIEDYSLARWQVDAHAYWRSSGNRLLTVDELASLGPDKLAKLFTDYSLTKVYDFEAHVQIGHALELRGALPSTFMSLAPGSWHPDVWHDVTRMLTLNSEQSRRAVEKHVCPLQFDIVDRLIERYSNKGERVYDPFCGLGTVPYRAILKGRTGGGSELNPNYFTDQVHYLRAAEREISMPSLFDAFELEAA
ncbi:MAG: DNA methyltransferase [Roseateles sp.]|uniref:DNA methyltransferase n=1 Tax=Roseateles sp. TaxID=1971397 RepID=UPI004035DFBE